MLSFAALLADKDSEELEETKAEVGCRRAGAGVDENKDTAEDALEEEEEEEDDDDDDEDEEEEDEEEDDDDEEEEGLEKTEYEEACVA